MLPLVSDWVSGNWEFGHKEWLLRQCHTWYLDKETKNSRQKKAGTMTPLWEPKLTFSLNCEEKLTRVQSRECPLEWWSFSIPVALWDYCPMVFTYPHCCVLAKKRLFSTVCFLDLSWRGERGDFFLVLFFFCSFMFFLHSLLPGSFLGGIWQAERGIFVLVLFLFFLFFLVFLHCDSLLPGSLLGGFGRQREREIWEESRSNKSKCTSNNFFCSHIFLLFRRIDF